MKKEELSLREQALLTAAEQGRTEQVLYYLVTNTDTECRDDYGNTPLILAATGGHLATAELLLEHGADPHASTTWGTTPFLAACQSGCIPLIKRLLAEGADAYAESAEMRAVAVLLEAGVNVNMRDRATHRTPLFAACAPAGEEVRPALVKRLLAAGADVNAVDDCGQTPLHALAMLPATPAAARVRKLLLRAGADAQHRDVFGKTAAEYA